MPLDTPCGFITWKPWFTIWWLPSSTGFSGSLMSLFLGTVGRAKERNVFPYKSEEEYAVYRSRTQNIVVMLQKSVF